MNLDGALPRIVRLAVEYECRTGRHAGDLTLGQLAARTATLRQMEKLRTFEMAKAVATAMSGNEKAWDALTE
ncbi:hypothetical protein [Sinorhizobium meliloti]|uniref:hypothetical protein n=1 Tax=Rhizobium meliloti TaxID=382 RepID=UPI000FE0BD5D|nr:hypothetical protein [Sinorhizobium meliloti]MDX1216315.1 hypothetical protein [Sinorhizobium medicae]RVG70909.1 hypothetical protein CN222_01870 [Sinorhizobium meliloti]